MGRAAQPRGCHGDEVTAWGLSAPIDRPEPWTMRVGILGCGHVSDQYFRGCALFDELEVVACADVDVDRAARQAAVHGVPKACSAEALLDDPEVELIANLTPPQAHAAVSADVLRAGKHVWSEKPLAATLIQARELLEVVRDCGLRLGCAPDTFLGGGLQTSFKLVREGWIGEPLAAVACVSEPGYEHFHPNVESFYSAGGGPALDLGPYYVTALVGACGPVARVHGATRRPGAALRTVLRGPRAGTPIAVEVPTHVSGVIELENGLLATLLMSWDIWATNLPYLEMYGSQGSVAFPNPDEFGGAPRLRRAGAEELSQPPPAPGTLDWTSIPLVQRDDAARGIGMADMARAILQGRPHRASAELAYHVLEVLCALTSSADRAVEIESTCEIPAPIGPDP